MASSPQRPTVLLVVDKDWTADVLRNLHVPYEIKDLKDLIWDNSGRRQDTRAQRQRSRSPTRSNNGSSTEPTRDPRRRSSPSLQRPDCAAVYLIDVKELYLTMSTENDSIQNRIVVHDLALRMGMTVDFKKWNAGNEAV